jgi:hypothetical protein
MHIITRPVRILLLLSCIPVLSIAQQAMYLTNPDYRFFGGLVFGTNFSQVDGDTYSGYNKVGINTGGIVYARLSGNVGASMEFNYTQKGSHAISNSASAALGTYFSEYRLKLNYIEIPFILHILTDRKLHYEAGVSYAQLLNFNESLYSDPGVVIDPNVYYFHKTDICFNAGLCYQFYNWWFLEARFQYSITSIRDAERIPIGGPTQYNNLVMIRLIRYLNKYTNNQ